MHARKQVVKKSAFVKELELTRKRILDSFVRYTDRTHKATNYKDVKNVDCQLCLTSLKFKVCSFSPC